MSQKCLTAILLCLIPGVPAPPGKSTIAASDPLHSMAFNLKYFPVTPAQDEGAGNKMSSDVQGRVQVLSKGSYTERNCQLFSSKGQLSEASKYSSMTQNGVGKACSYSSGQKYGSGTEMHKVFSYNQGQCCNACVATEGCVAATFLASDKDHSGGQGPQTWEGFGIHTVDVTSAKTTGGIPVDQLEANFRSRFGSMEAFDQFMDYSITFFTADLQPYYDGFTNDKVPFLLTQWETTEKDTWYSLFVLVNRSHHVIELVSHQKPTTTASTDLPQLEQRMSSRHCAKYKDTASDPAHLLLVASINRATSNITAIDDVYANLFMMTPTFQVDDKGVEKRCYNSSSASSEQSATLEFPPGPGGLSLDIDICFTQRPSDPEKDKIFSVLGFEQMLWAEHAGTLGSNPSSMSDKYTDNHFAMPMPSKGLTALKSYFTAHSTYPVTKDHRIGYACKQDYIIDPTGWSIQPIGSASWPNCGWSDAIVV